MSVALRMHHSTDPKVTISEALGDAVDGITLYGADILVGTYTRPEKTASGIILADSTRGEDEFQGKIGLILKVGPLAFKDEAFFGKAPPAVGDWVMFRVAEAFPFKLGKAPCRQLEDKFVRGKVSHPDLVW